MDIVYSVREAAARPRSAVGHHRNRESTNSRQGLSILPESQLGAPISRAAHLRSAVREFKTDHRRLSQDTRRHVFNRDAHVRTRRGEILFGEYVWTPRS